MGPRTYTAGRARTSARAVVLRSSGAVCSPCQSPARDVAQASTRRTVSTPHGEVMVPFVSAIVPEVDIAAGTVTVTPPPGLFEELPEEPRSAAEAPPESEGDAPEGDAPEAGEPEAHLDARQHPHQHQLVEVPEMTEAERATLEPAETGAERHVEAIEDQAAQPIGVVPFR